MSELKTPDKTVQKMTRDGAVEVNKATGGADRISARDAAIEHNPGGDILGGVVERVGIERQIAKKKATRKANRKIFESVQSKPETTRLQFTDAERADPAMSKDIHKSDKAADRYEAARAKIPKQKVLTIERVPAKQDKPPPKTSSLQFSDKSAKPGNQRVAAEPTGKTETRLVFRERDKPPNGKLTHVLERPGREAANITHSEISKYEKDNTGVQAAHSAEKAAEGMVRTGGAIHGKLKFEPQRKLLQAEKKAVKANLNALYKRDLQAKPELKNANPIKKAAHKRNIKKQYAAAFRQGNVKGAKAAASRAAKTAARIKIAIVKAVKFAAVNWKIFAVAGGILFFVILLAAGISSCMAMFGGSGTAIIGTSYTAEDEDITGADADYTALENGLRQRINRIETDYPGYNEYRYSLDEIGHDPFELASYLTAKFNMYTRAEVQAELAALFAQQYTLTLTPITEIRYRTETRTESYTYTDPVTGETYTEEYTYEVQVPYYYYILNVSLTNRSLGSVAQNNLTPEQAEMYAVYMETKGNKPELFADNVYVNRGEYTDYDIPPDALNDVKFAAMIQEAEKYLGYPYVWGGSSPSTSFDCSGFVSWVINQSGVGSVGRMTANGLFNHCAIIPPGEAKPGDLIFFQGTYDASGASHVGIYVGNGMMIHCGNPISYASVNTNYWTSHFYAYGRLP